MDFDSPAPKKQKQAANNWISASKSDNGKGPYNGRGKYFVLATSLDDAAKERELIEKLAKLPYVDPEIKTTENCKRLLQVNILTTKHFESLRTIVEEYINLGPTSNKKDLTHVQQSATVTIMEGAVDISCTTTALNTYLIDYFNGDIASDQKKCALVKVDQDVEGVETMESLLKNLKKLYNKFGFSHNIEDACATPSCTAACAACDYYCTHNDPIECHVATVAGWATPPRPRPMCEDDDFFEICCGCMSDARYCDMREVDWLAQYSHLL